jgi:hypothetical protein
MAEETGRITVSRDALRADMAELELRLQAFIRRELSAKADAADVIALRREVEALEVQQRERDQGKLTDAQLRVIDSRITEKFKAQSETAWTWKERTLAVLSACVTIATLALSIVLALHGGYFG